MKSRTSTLNKKPWCLSGGLNNTVGPRRASDSDARMGAGPTVLCPGARVGRRHRRKKLARYLRERGAATGRLRPAATGATSYGKETTGSPRAIGEVGILHIQSSTPGGWGVFPPHERGGSIHEPWRSGLGGSTGGRKGSPLA